ncbi:MAG: metalloregulator ArsR/SmtB family transcription factor [Rudaea sp.]|uniref:ArsR/SmtB family transcription factor n=1 Tax=Rudaea sp. TaxID=2136325 RepID=UPI0039E5D587
MKRARTPAKKPRADTAAAAMQRHADEAVAVLKGLASRNRLLLCRLFDGERSVGELAQALGLAQSVVSQHLSLLRREGVVAGRRDAQSIRYRIADARVRKLMATMFALFCKD